MDHIQESRKTPTFSILVTISVLLIWYCYHLWNNRRFIRMGLKLPGPIPIPFFGNCWLALKTMNPADTLLLFLNEYKKYGTVGRIFLGTRLIVGTSDPRDVEIILGGYKHLEKSKEYDLFKPWLGDGLLINSGEKWRSHRKIIVPTFHNSILKTFVPVFNSNSRAVIRTLEKQIGKTIDVHDYMSTVTVDVLLETAMGMKRNDKYQKSSEGFKYAKAVMEMCNIIHQRHYKFWLRPDFIFKLSPYVKIQKQMLDIIHSLTLKVLKLKRNEYYTRKLEGKTSLYEEAVKHTEYFEKPTPKINVITGLRDDLDENDENDVGEKKRLAFLDYLIEASFMKGNQLSDEDIKNEVDTIMFEGHDTTAAASSFVLCMLGVHQDVQQKVVEELNSIFQDSNRPISYNDTLEMKYLERVILETMRLYPPVPLIARKLEEDVRLVSGHVFPKGATAVICQLIMHRSPEYFPNPLVFNPDNFLPEKCAKRHYYSYIPFSAGPRSCVGRKYAMLKLKILLGNVIRNFKIISDVPEKDFKLQGDIILKRTDGFRLRLDKR